MGSRLFKYAPLTAGLLLVAGVMASDKTLLTAVKDGAPAADDAKEQVSAKEFVVRNEAQREFGAFVERLRELADVEVRSTN